MDTCGNRGLPVGETCDRPCDPRLFTHVTQGFSLVRALPMSVSFLCLTIEVSYNPIRDGPHGMTGKCNIHSWSTLFILRRCRHSCSLAQLQVLIPSLKMLTRRGLTAVVLFVCTADTVYHGLATCAFQRELRTESCGKEHI